MDTFNNVYNLFEEKIKKFPDKTAIVISSEKITYKDLNSRINKWTDFLLSIGVKKGERFIISTDHKYDFIALWLSLWKIGAVPIPLEPSSNNAELERALEAGKPHWLCSENKKHAELLSEANMHKYELHPDWIIAAIVSEEIIDSIPNSAFYAYTSGTSGAPKCVMYDNDATVAILESLIEAFHLTEKDVLLTPMSPSLPSVIFTAILPALSAGSTLVLLNEPLPSRTIKALNETKTTVLFCVPYFYKLLVEAMQVRNTKLEHLRLCVSTSAYLDKKTFSNFYELTNIPIRSIFCSSEAFYCTFNPYDDLNKLSESVGIPLKGVSIRIVDKEGNNTDNLQEGEILVSGTHKSKGYFCRPELEEKVYKDGWIHTGDLGYLDEDGYLYITGRLSNTVNIAGHLVNPQEVETVLTSYPGVYEAVMLGEKDEIYGERILAKIVLKPGAEVKIDDIVKYCKTMLLPHKIPSKIEIVESLPKSRYGKIRRVN
ncbi:long-chain-fatty-acid--CoA ligase [Anaerocolumna cellulosilytica]|uniref:Long-chain-fatty-acid--CoA ligase n=1 Tax=Anaerocolumna cellulosilytica TaxID=433286 RepID=A0A6S6QW68_9FIRM|nr:class I adenylate-forming enzyme family protein [Anaerocolumna cellulosilytica]MBB5193932.1 acyl-coenzyme A synthetase/AMP-(fatty) acid ligase [Anaerocolumna cellulosilytica]BCJ94854.1 long-chain-fatty-acid--CoA ligase [Anaerocolumna cellulosilytica]